jgi:hypothetical protein
VKAHSDIPANRTLKPFTALRTGLVVAVLAFLFATTFAVPRAAADPTWKFVETSCEAISGGNGGDCSLPPPFPPGLTLPLTIGQFTGSGTYVDDVPLDFDLPPEITFSESGNFSLDFANFHFTSNSPAYCFVSFIAPCNVDISLTDSSAGVYGNVDLFDGLNEVTVDMTFNGSTFSAFLGSETSPLEGCGDVFNDSGCYVSGDLVPAPEPSSLPMLLAGLGLLGGAMYFGRKQVKVS